MKKLFLTAALCILQSAFNNASSQIICIFCYEQNDSISQNVNNLMLNGGFENNNCIANLYSSSFCPNSQYYSCTVPNWLCTGGGIDSYPSIDDNTFTVTADGTQAAYFGNGSNARACSPIFNDTSCFATTTCELPNIPAGYPTNDPSYGANIGVSLEQTVSGLTIGNTYVLEFWAGGEPQTNGWMDAGVFGIDVGFGNTLLRNKPTQIIPLSIGTRYIIEFNATATSHTIKFTNWGHVCIPCTELIIDNVRLYTLAELSPSVPPCTGAIPVANYIASGTLICPGTCIDFTNLSVNATSYQWIFTGANPSTSTSSNPQLICYDTPGSYDVTLIATNATTSDTLVLSNYISVFPQPITPVLSQSGDTVFSSQGYVTYQWFFVSDTIPGATNYFYVTTQSGNYNLVVTDSNGCAVGAGILNWDIGVYELGAGNLKFEVLPNPNDGNFVVNFSSIQNETYFMSIFNSLGEKIYSASEKNSSCKFHKEISLKDFAEGIYVLQIHSHSGILNKKFVIQQH